MTVGNDPPITQAAPCQQAGAMPILRLVTVVRATANQTATVHSVYDAWLRDEAGINCSVVASVWERREAH
jgi:hypothetical protein